MAATDSAPAQAAATMFNQAQVGSMVGCTFNLNAGHPVISQAETRATTAEMIGWLSPINFRAIQSENAKKHTVGTGEWLLKDENFLDWKADDIKVFWITGMPGSGKTVLCAATNKALKREFETQSNVLFVMVFCRYDNKLTAAQIAGAITCQILDSTKDEQVLCLIHDFYQKHKRERTTPELGDFVELFEQVFPLYDRVVTSIDAFDETSEEVRQELLEAFEQLDVSLFITSRPSVDHFKAMLPAVHSLRLEDKLTHTGDIERFIRAKLSRTPRLMAILRERPDLLEEACSTLVVKSKGMFLLAALHIASLQRATSARHMMDLIDALPAELMTMYQHTWSRIKAQDPDSFDLARRTFLWVLYASDTLGTDDFPQGFIRFFTTTYALRHFLAVSIAERAYALDSPPPQDLIKAVCEGLIDFEEESETVRLAHYTTRDFLASDAIQCQISPSPYAELVASLITAITSWGLVRQFPYWGYPDGYANGGFLIPYVHDAWPYHYGRMKDSERSLVWSMLGATSPLQPFAQYQLWLPYYTFPMDTVDIVTPAHIAAYYPSFNLPHVALEGAHTRSSLGFLPIHYLLFARRNRQDDPHQLSLLVSMLDHGVDVDAADATGLTPLMLAECARNEAATSVLISHPSCNLTKVDVRGRTALHYAAMGVWPHRSPRALPADIRLVATCGVNSVDVDGRTPFHCLQIFDFSSVADGDPGLKPLELKETLLGLLLDHPEFDVNLPDKQGITPLMRVVHSLLDTWVVFEAVVAKQGLRVNQQDEKGATALHHLAERIAFLGHDDFGRCCTESLRILLAHPDIDVSIRNHEGLSPLDTMNESLAEYSWKGELFDHFLDMLRNHPSASRTSS